MHRLHADADVMDQLPAKVAAVSQGAGTDHARAGVRSVRPSLLRVRARPRWQQRSRRCSGRREYQRAHRGALDVDLLAGDQPGDGRAHSTDGGYDRLCLNDKSDAFMITPPTT